MNARERLLLSNGGQATVLANNGEVGAYIAVTPVSDPEQVVTLVIAGGIVTTVPANVTTELTERPYLVVQQYVAESTMVVEAPGGPSQPLEVSLVTLSTTNESSSLSLKDLSVPIRIVFPIVHDNSTAGPMSVQEQTLMRCSYWDVTAGHWSTDGLSTLVNGSTVTCLTNHLTLFAVVYEQVNELIEDVKACADASVLVDFPQHASNSGIDDIFLALILPCIMLLLFALHFISARQRDAIFVDPSEKDDLALQLYFWDEEAPERGLATHNCCKRRAPENNDVSENAPASPSGENAKHTSSTQLVATLKTYASQGKLVAERGLENTLRGLAGAEEKGDRTVLSKQGIRFSRMFTTISNLPERAG